MKEDKSLKARRANMTKKQNLFIEAFVNTGWNVTASCSHVGISRDTYYRWLKSNERFSQKIQHSKSSRDDWVVSKLNKAIEQGEPWAIERYLDSKGKHLGFSPKKEVDLNTTFQDTSGLQIVSIKKEGGKEVDE